MLQFPFSLALFREREQNPWEEAKSLYIARYRTQLEKIATAFGTQLRLNLKEKHVEFYLPDGEVRATASMWGEYGLANELTVTSPPIPWMIKEMFIRFFGDEMLVEFKTIGDE